MASQARRNRTRALAAGAPDGRSVGRLDGSNYLRKHPEKDFAGRKVLDSIGREHLVQVLSGIVPEDDIHSPEGRLLAYLEDGNYDGHSLTRLCRDAGLTTTEIVELTRNYDIAMGVLRASRHVPDVLEDIAEDARSQIVGCPTCGSEGVVAPEGVDLNDDELLELLDINKLNFPKCSVCNGAGWLRQIGDTDSRKLLLETLGLVNKKAPQALIQRNTQINNYAGGEAPENISDRIQRIIENPKTTGHTDG